MTEKQRLFPAVERDSSLRRMEIVWGKRADSPERIRPTRNGLSMTSAASVRLRIDTLSACGAELPKGNEKESAAERIFPIKASGRKTKTAQNELRTLH